MSKHNDILQSQCLVESQIESADADGAFTAPLKSPAVKDTLDEHIRGIRYAVASVPPHAVYPVCDGSEDECAVCDGRGWLTRDQHDALESQ